MRLHRLNVMPLIGLALAGVVSSQVIGTAQTLGQPEHFTASYVDLNTGRTGPVELDVRRWSTSAERATLVETLFKQGSDRLLDKLRDMRAVGRIYTPGSIGYDLRFSLQRALPDGGREIILATDRPMSFWEVTNAPRSSQYPFTWVQFRMTRDGTGEGKIAVAARIIGEEADRLIEVEDFAIQPVRLQNIRSRKGDN
ncbi:MAG: hypothetical protein EHM55_07695 [Acidobacteria bacterium]|nr:MAG: hypothetical protein EHM55_07695 [Acidobacteriota bacterium]